MEYKNLIGKKITDKINIYNCDNIELMAQTPDKYYDLAIVDPPYGINIGNMSMGIGNKPKSSKSKNRKWKAKDWDSAIPTDEYFKELKRISKNQIVWGGNYFNLGICHKFIIWYKEIPKGLSFSDCEYAWTSFNGANKIFKYSAYLNKIEKFHPTQKPPQLYKWILANYAKEGDKILDTHLGSGSIAIACHDYGYELTGCELDNEYYNQSVKRINNHVSQLKLF